jgi:hypothetical protein
MTSILDWGRHRPPIQFFEPFSQFNAHAYSEGYNVRNLVDALPGGIIYNISNFTARPRWIGLTGASSIWREYL